MLSWAWSWRWSPAACWGRQGLLLAVLWLVAGLVTLSRLGERLLTRTVLRYRPAPGSWLEAEVRRLLPGRRVDVYVAPKATGVFALGGHTIGLGEASRCWRSHPAPAGGHCGRGRRAAPRTHPARAAADLVGGAVVGRQTDPPTPGAAPVAAADQGVGGPLLVAVSIVSSVHGGSPSAVALTVCGLSDLCITSMRSRRLHRLARRQLHPLALVLAPTGRVA